MNKNVIFVIGFFLLSVTASFADTVYLKNGKIYEGKIVSHSQYSTKILIKGMPKNFYPDQIDRVEFSRETLAETAAEKSQAQERPLETGEITEAKRQLILRLLEANGALEGIRRSLRSLLGKVSPEMRAEFEKNLKAETLTEQFVPIYAKYYTEQELKDMVRFYSSSTGQRVLAVTPKIVKETLDASIQYFQAMDKKEPAQP